MSIVKGAPHAQAARQLYDWALTPQAQQFAFAARGFQVPSNKATPLDPRVPDIQKLKLIDYDYAKFGAPAERQRIIKTWEARVRAMPQ
jgi:iron(III) transport system substrate-binding protein